MGDNLILYDWLSFTVRGFHPMDVAHLLGMDFVEWQRTKGFYGYRQRLLYSGVSIHFDGAEDQGVLLEMSGSGCRTFESVSEVGWDALFDTLEQLPDEHKLHYTRLDIAFDDHTGILPLSQLVEDTRAENWVSPFRWSQIEEGVKDNHACVLYFGSPQSETRIRIYDKAAERHAEDEGHWVRVELQLRRDRAASFISRRSMGLRDLFLAVLVNYLRFVQPSDDTNKSRWPTADYWAQLIDGVAAVSIFSAPGQEYNRDRLDSYVYGQIANPVYTAMVLDGDKFYSKIMELQRRSGGLPLKYVRLLQEWASWPSSS